MEKIIKDVYGVEFNQIDTIIQSEEQIKEVYKRMGNITDGMTAFDATSLYPSAMKTLESLPDLESYEMLINPTFNEVYKYKHFVIKCDIHIPEHLKFVPIPVKLTNKEYAEMNSIQKAKSP